MVLEIQEGSRRNLHYLDLLKILMYEEHLYDFVTLTDNSKASLVD